MYAFDGATWTTVLPDGHEGWAASYYNALAALDGRLWLFNGYTGTEELVRALYSDNAGATWLEHPGGSGGGRSDTTAPKPVPLASRLVPPDPPRCLGLQPQQPRACAAAGRTICVGARP